MKPPEAAVHTAFAKARTSELHGAPFAGLFALILGAIPCAIGSLAISQWGLSHRLMGAFPAPRASTPTDLVCPMGDLQATSDAKSHKDLRQLFRDQACMQAAHASVLHYSCRKGNGHCREGNCRAHIQLPTATTTQVCCTALAPQLCFTRASRFAGSHV